MARYVKEIDVVDESDEEIERVLQEKNAQSTNKSTKFANSRRKRGKTLIKDWQGFLQMTFANVFL